MTPSTALRSVMFPAITLTLACPIHGTTPAESEVDVRGCYLRGFEASEFYPQRGAHEMWWVSAAPEGFYTQFRKLSAPRGPTEDFSVMIRIKGTLSAPGQYGHMGRATRELRIVSFADMQALGGGASCRTPSTPPVALRMPTGHMVATSAIVRHRLAR